VNVTVDSAIVDPPSNAPLQPSEVRADREGFGMSQQAFADALGVVKVRVCTAGRSTGCGARSGFPAGAHSRHRTTQSWLSRPPFSSAAHTARGDRKGRPCAFTEGTFDA